MLYRFCSSEISFFTIWVHPVAWHFDTTSYSSHHLVPIVHTIMWQNPATWLECRQQNAATNISKRVHQTLPSPVQKWVGPWDYMTSCCSYLCVWLALQYTLTRCIWVRKFCSHLITSWFCLEMLLTCMVSYGHAVAISYRMCLISETYLSSRNFCCWHSYWL